MSDFYTVDRYVAAMNLELAIAAYFSEPTVEQAKASRVLISSLQEDQEKMKLAFQRNNFSGCVIHHDSGL